MQKILLHACCAVCASYPIKKLKNEGCEPIVYFYNPNIYPKSQYDIRLNELINYCLKEQAELIVEPYTPQDFALVANGLENCPEKGSRCLECFKLRLKKTAEKASELNICKFTTTLSVSAHKVSGMIFEAGNYAAKLSGNEFLEYDFKKNDGFKITQAIAKQNNMYKQTYCGCKYSIREPKV